MVHLIRASLRYASYTDRKKPAHALRPVYTAPTADAAEAALLELADTPWAANTDLLWPCGSAPGNASSRF